MYSVHVSQITRVIHEGTSLYMYIKMSLSSTLSLPVLRYNIGMVTYIYFIPLVFQKYIIKLTCGSFIKIHSLIFEKSTKHFYIFC